MTIQFTANVEPRGKQRARQVMRGGYVHSYTPRETVEFEREIGKACMIACKGVQMPENAPLYLEAIFYMPIPKSVPKWLRERMMTEQVYHTKKPDTSNILKSVEDAIIGIAYKDDAQIACECTKKVYSERPRVEVTIFALGRE